MLKLDGHEQEDQEHGDLRIIQDAALHQHYKIRQNKKRQFHKFRIKLSKIGITNLTKFYTKMLT